MSSSSSLWNILVGQCSPSEEILSINCAQNEGPSFHSSDSFLVPHQPDRPIRCIIESAQVNKAIQHQGDEMMRRDYRNRMDESEGIRRTELARKEMHKARASSWDEDVMSIVGETVPSITMTEAKTDITTGTVATRLAANLDRYSRAKPKYNHMQRLASFTVLDAIQHNKSSSGSTTSLDLLGIRDRFASKSSSKERGQSPKRRSTKQGTPLINSNEACLSSLSPCLGETMGIVLKEEYYHALHLQLHFHALDFYRKSFLPMFPNSPIPIGLQRSLSKNSCHSLSERPPQLMKSVSSSTNSTRSPTRGIGFGISDVPSLPIKFMVDESSFMDLGIAGTLGLVDRGNMSPSKLMKKAPEHYLVLMNRRSGVPLAVCALKSPYGEPVVRIYATKQRVVGQHPAASTTSLGLDWSAPYPLYAWAEVTAVGEFPLPVRYSMYMAAGSNGCFEKEPSYRAYHKTVGSPDLLVVGRTETEHQFTGCATLSMQTDEVDDEVHFSTLSISRGIDPALLVCFAAIVDETMERTMRLQCEVACQRRSNKSRR